MEASAHLEQAPNAAVDLRRTPRGCRDARQDLEERRLPGPVPADDAEDLPFGNAQRNVAECPDVLEVRGVAAPDEPTSATREGVA